MPRRVGRYLYLSAPCDFFYVVYDIHSFIQPIYPTYLPLGIEHEDEIRQQYATLIDRPITEIGLVIDQTNPIFAASPDGMVDGIGRYLPTFIMLFGSQTNMHLSIYLAIISR